MTMKTSHNLNFVVTALVCALAATAAQAQTAPKMKMTTSIPPEITTPDSVETRLGTLKFFDGFPDQATIDKVYDNLDFQRGVQAFLTAVPGPRRRLFAPGYDTMAPTTRRPSCSNP
jgi:hypothetical protein